jgi:hypothetical protein
MSGNASTLGQGRLPAAIPLAMGLAWAAALAAHVGGFADHFHHDAIVGDHGTISVATLAGFAALWTIMVAAMMLPSAVPLLRLFIGASSGQKHPGRMVACLVAGYLAVWSLFGWVALGFDGGVHQTVDAITWLSDRPWLVGAATLALAGPSSSPSSRTAASPSAVTPPRTRCAITGAGRGQRSKWDWTMGCTALVAAGRSCW